MLNFFRFFSAQLSFFFLNKKISEKNENKILKEINLKFKKKIFLHKSELKTHAQFNIYLKKLIIEKRFKNFLRESVIQKIFFVHNRIYIFFMLIKIIFNKNKLYRKLLVEDNIGNPVRYFLYPKSSGNRIREVYHLLTFSDFIKIPLSKITNIYEFGGGYGNMARLFYKINKNINYNIFDTYFVSFLQYYYLRMLKIPVNFDTQKNKNITLNYNASKYINKKINKKSLFIANWSLSESPIKLREIILKKINNFDFILISYQSNFENINNHKYFSDLTKELKIKNFYVHRQKIPYINFLRFSNKHYYLFIKRNY